MPELPLTFPVLPDSFSQIHSSIGPNTDTTRARGFVVRDITAWVQIYSVAIQVLIIKGN